MPQDGPSLGPNGSLEASLGALESVSGVSQVGTMVASVLYFTNQNASFVNLGVGLAVIRGAGCSSPMCVLYYFLQIRMLLPVASLACLFGLWRRSLCIDRLAIGWQRLYGVFLVLPGCVVWFLARLRTGRGVRMSF